MYDPCTVAHEIKSPFRERPSSLFRKGYRPALVTIWHVDPEDARGMCVRRGDDTRGWFTPPYTQCMAWRWVPSPDFRTEDIGTPGASLRSALRPVKLERGLCGLAGKL